MGDGMSSNGIGRLTGKVALVTGAGSRSEIIGNGQAAALLFANKGVKSYWLTLKRKIYPEHLERFQIKVERRLFTYGM